MRESFEQVFKLGPRDLGLELVYDVAHNIAKIEEHTVDGKKTKALRPPQGRHPGLSAAITRSCRRPTGRRASRC